MNIKDTIVRIRKFASIKFLVIGCITICVFLGLIVFIAVEASKRYEKKVEKNCKNVHEGYGFFLDNTLRQYSKFAVACDNDYCSTLGKTILLRNGSAVDALIATGLCNSIMNTQSMGIGGGHFMNIYIKKLNKSFIIDAREVAPINSDENMFVKNRQLLASGGLATGVPGEIMGLYEAHKIGGSLPWEELFQPTIDLCLNGFQLSKALAKALRMRESFIRKNNVLSSKFINPETNQPYAAGDIIRLPELGKTLTKIAQLGPDYFYNGPLTGLMVAEINDNGGNITLEDFSSYKVRIYEDQVARIDDKFKMSFVPPPSSNILVPFILRIMMKYNYTSSDFNSNESEALFYHRFVEAFKYAFAHRSKLADDQFVNISNIIENLGNDDYINEIKMKIDNTRTYPSSHYDTVYSKDDAGTSHISVLAENGDAVSYTSSLNNLFGAKYMGKYTGIIYNDVMDDFSTPGIINTYGLSPASANFIKPGKRPLSSMSPTIIIDENNDVKMVIGAGGGSKIFTTISQISLRTIWMNSNIKTEIDRKRFHHQLYPNNIELEEGFPDKISEILKKLGHSTACYAQGGSIIQAIEKIDNKIFAYSDPRKGGQPDGL